MSSAALDGEEDLDPAAESRQSVLRRAAVRSAFNNDSTKAEAETLGMWQDWSVAKQAMDVPSKRLVDSRQAD